MTIDYSIRSSIAYAKSGYKSAFVMDGLVEWDLETRSVMFLG